MKPLIWILGGTTEGREIAQFLMRRKIQSYVSVATAYGASLLPDSPYCTVLKERMDEAAMKEFLEVYRPALVIDATHPYATAVTAHIQAACRDGGVPYKRVIRCCSEEQDWITVYSMQEAAMYLQHTKGNIFLATGSKDLDVFTQIPDYAERIAVRILPSLVSLERALSLGYQGKHIVCMQGPFDTAVNTTMFRHFHAAYVVTKDSGKAGGFADKVCAARNAGAALLVVGRQEEKGMTQEEMLQWLAANV